MSVSKNACGRNATDGLIRAENGERREMADELTGAADDATLGRRTARRLFEGEAYRRIVAGDVPETLSEFAVQLSAWFKDNYPTAPAVPVRFVEGAIRDTWHRRHEIVGSEL